MKGQKNSIPMSTTTLGIVAQVNITEELTCELRYGLTSPTVSDYFLRALQQKWLIKTYRGINLESVTEEWRDVPDEKVI